MAFSDGRYARALTAYQRAWQAKPLPGLLFNIAQCHRLLGHHAKAERLYRMYLEAVPRTRNRAVVVSLIEEMRARQQQQEQQRQQRAGPDAPSPRDPAHTGSPSVSAPAVLVAPGPPSPPPWLTNDARPWSGTGTGTAADGASQPSGEVPLYRRWPLWLGLGLVSVAAVAVGLGFGLRAPAHDPSGTLATVDAR